MKRALKWAAAVVTSLAAVFVLLQFLPARGVVPGQNPWRPKPGQRPLVMAVHYWTINDADEMKRLIQLGADGLMTDRPDRMMQVLAEMGR